MPPFPRRPLRWRTPGLAPRAWPSRPTLAISTRIGPTKGLRRAASASGTWIGSAAGPCPVGRSSARRPGRRPSGRSHLAPVAPARLMAECPRGPALFPAVGRAGLRVARAVAAGWESRPGNGPRAGGLAARDRLTPLPLPIRPARDQRGGAGGPEVARPVVARPPPRRAPGSAGRGRRTRPAEAAHASGGSSRLNGRETERGGGLSCRPPGARARREGVSIVVVPIVLTSGAVAPRAGVWGRSAR
jgi:hypothetical protein